MLQTATPTTGAQTTMPGMRADVSSKKIGYSALQPFKDLMRLHKEAGVAEPASDAAVPVAVQVPVPVSAAAEPAAGLYALVVDDDAAPLPALDGGSKSPESATRPQVTPSQECLPSESQCLAGELQESAMSSATKEPSSGKLDHVAHAFSSKDGKTSSKRHAMSVATLVVATSASEDVVATKVNIVASDSGVPKLQDQTTLLIKGTDGKDDSAKLQQGIATSKTSTAKIPLSIEEPTSPESECLPQTVGGAANFSSAVADQLFPVETNTVETGTRAVRVASEREPAFAVPVPQAAVVFHASLLHQGKSDVPIAIPDEESTSPPTETMSASLASSPVNHLDLQWKDGALGSISVRAEMREGSLHATVNGSHVGSAVSVTDLHQFLEDNRVAVHSLQVNGVAEVKPVVERHSFATTDALVGNGGQASHSHRDESRRSSARESSAPGRPRDVVEEMSTAIATSAISYIGQAGNGRLSIHI